MTVDWILTAITTCALLSLVYVLYRSRLNLRHTTLLAAWKWAIPGGLLWIAAWRHTVVMAPLENPLNAQLWYAAAVGLLCPPIAVLGARRPTVRAWGWFVVVPLCLVFGWPLTSTWGVLFDRVPWVLEEPMLLGFCLVLVMGLGNFVGTRYTISALFYACALLLVVIPLCPATIGWVADPRSCRVLGTLSLAIAGWSGMGMHSLPQSTHSPLDGLWQDFRNTFGVVWSRRIQERFNETARGSNWPYRLASNGLVNEAGHPLADGELPLETAAQMEGTLRWLLRRFVDPEWFDGKVQSLLEGERGT